MSGPLSGCRAVGLYGDAPPAWTIGTTHDGGAPQWEVIADPSAPSKPNVLAQTSTGNTSGRFPPAIYNKSTFADGVVSVRFKPVAGERDRAAERGLALRAISRGTVPDAMFGATTVAGLKADGVAMREGTPRLVAADDLQGAEQVVTFGLRLPGGLPAGPRVDWTGTPSPTADYGAARNDIRARVEALLGKLAGGKAH